MQIEDAIPHRPPFLLIDDIMFLDDQRIRVGAAPKSDDELMSRVYAGHYPGNPITPGVLLCEMVFQAAGVLLSHRLGASEAGVPVLVKIKDARFRKMVRPDQPLEVEVVFLEQVSSAFYMKGSVTCEGKIALRVEFTCAMMSGEG